MFAIYGTGAMAPVYLEGLIGSGIAADRIVVVGRRGEAARAVAAHHGAHAAALGCEGEYRPTSAIVAVTPDALPSLTRCALDAGARKLLIEKPGALDSSELSKLHDAVVAAGANAHVVFQRRFLPAVARCQDLIREDGGAIACFFEMTEIEQHVLSFREKQGWPQANFARWGLVNPIHVLDLAVWLVGEPLELEPRREGSLSWHPSGATFSGTSTSNTGAALVYLATWGTAGRWRIEVTTRHRRLFLCPLESLDQQLSGSFAITKVDIPSEPAGAKPGFTALFKEFLASDGPSRLPDLKQTARLLGTAERIFGYA
jgi:predicted dehydrogenase